MIKLTIDRQTWIRGDIRSALLRSKDNKMCCLGFLSLACGYTKEEIRDRVTPFTMLSKDKYPPLQIQEDCKVGLKDLYLTFTSGLMRINDGNHTETERESQLKELFAKMDIDVEFIN